MTCIVGVAKDNRVYMGGDSAAVTGMTVIRVDDPKVFQEGPYLFGFSGSFRMGNLLRHAFSPPPFTYDDEYFEQFLVTDFIDNMRRMFRDNGFHQDPETGSGSFLLGAVGKLYYVDADWQIGRAVDDYLAIGGGADIALGALYATKTKAPRARILTALEASAEHCSGVRGPFHVLELK